MSDCCANNTSPTANETPRESVACPKCGHKGKPVTVRLLKHQLRPEHLTRVLPGELWYFCTASDCPIVYFDTEDQQFVTGDLRVAVTQKSTGRERPLCYCFGFTEGMLEDELAANGATTIPDRIRAEIKADHCACEIRNPQGSCCLGNVAAAQKALQASLT